MSEDRSLITAHAIKKKGAPPIHRVQPTWEGGKNTYLSEISPFFIAVRVDKTYMARST